MNSAGRNFAQIQVFTMRAHFLFGTLNPVKQIGVCRSIYAFSLLVQGAQRIAAVIKAGLGRFSGSYCGIASGFVNNIAALRNVGLNRRKARNKTDVDLEFLLNCLKFLLQVFFNSFQCTL